MRIPKAVKSGKIGSVDCYVLDDGRCVLSKNTTALALIGGSTETANLDRYITNLSKSVAGLEVRPSFEFTTTSGAKAQAIDDESLSNICAAYVRGLVMGQLGSRTLPVAQRAYQLQESWAKVGLRAHILAATGVSSRSAAMRDINDLIARLFRPEPGPRTVVYTTEWVDAVRFVYGHDRAKGEPRTVPHWMRSVFDKFYRLFLSADMAKVLKSKNPHPSSETSLHHQWFVEEVFKELVQLQRAVIYIARRSGRSKGYFWDQVEELLGIGSQRLLPGT